MRKTSKTHHGTLNELNITPLLDLAFVLLVIFIITTPQLVNNLELNLPSAPTSTTPPKDPARPSQVVVSPTGSVTLNGQAVSLDQLRVGLMALKRDNPDLALVVKGTRDTDYEHVIRVLDIVQQLQITKMGLATETAP